jgi:hypothetical protein
MTETPEVVEEAKKNLITRVREGFTYKDGKFSKTAMFASAANVLVLVAYVLSWGAGATISFGDAFSFAVPAFDTSAAIGLLTVINGTYIGNNVIKARK